MHREVHSVVLLNTQMQSSNRRPEACFVLALWLIGSLLKAWAGSEPIVQWQAVSGGTGNDLLYGLEKTADGGFMVAGASSSTNSAKKTAANLGGLDFWVAKLNSNGVALWDKSFGGTGDDGAFVVRRTLDDGFVFGGYSASSTNGNKTSLSYGARDFWIVRLDKEGNKLWDRAYGGSRDDLLYTLQQTSDGGFICAGESSSVVSGNKTSAGFGGIDFWVVRLDANGQKMWDKSYGGTGDEACYSLQITSDGGFILAGNSSSGAEGSKSSPGFGGLDYWVVRLDANGNKLWDVTLGGTADDGFNSVSVVQTPDGGYLVGGDSSSDPSGSKLSENYGLDDYWVVKLDGNGVKIWEQSLGGTGSDYLTSLAQNSDGSYLLAGGSESPAGPTKTSASLGQVDLWLVCIDNNGQKLWDVAYGGTDEDGFYNAAVMATSDGGLLIGGDSSSGASGNKALPGLGGRDYWVLKLDLVTRPTLFAPIQTNIAQNGFGLLLQGQLDKSYVTEYSSDLMIWFPLTTNRLTISPTAINDSSAKSVSHRFYRARELP